MEIITNEVTTTINHSEYGRTKGVEYLKKDKCFYKLIYDKMYQCISFKDNGDISFSSGDLNRLSDVESFDRYSSEIWHKTFQEYIEKNTF